MKAPIVIGLVLVLLSAYVLVMYFGLAPIYGVGITCGTVLTAVVLIGRAERKAELLRNGENAYGEDD